jgi:peptidyl-prolyl cis-trans isomerase C
MSIEQNSSASPKSSKGPIIAVIAGVLVLAGGAGAYVMTQKADTAVRPQVESTETASVNSETNGVENIAPAATSDDGSVAGIKMGDPVVAKMDKVEIKRSDVFNYIVTLPEQVRQLPLQTLFPLALEQVLNNRIISMKAAAAKLENDPEVTKILEDAREQVVRNVYVERELAKAVTQKELLAAYQKLLESFERVDEVRARHILVDDEAKALDIIAKLKAGEKFEDLAQSSMDQPTAANGGDLGYFAKTEMVPEFAEAAFALKPGDFTQTPVKTQFGFHVIKVEEKRKRPEPQFELVKPQLEAQLRREKLGSMLEQWQKEAKIQKFDINGEEIKTPDTKAKTKKN